jgi:hypothetical protein
LFFPFLKPAQKSAQDFGKFFCLVNHRQVSCAWNPQKADRLSHTPFVVPLLSQAPHPVTDCPVAIKAASNEQHMLDRTFEKQVGLGSSNQI